MQNLSSKVLYVMGFLFIITLTNCKDAAEPEPSKTTYSLDGDFSTNLFKAILNSSSDDENVIISPISISTVTKMILAGANGNTEKEITDAYGSASTKASLLADSKSFLTWLQTRKGQPTIELSNAFFYDKNSFHPLDGYKNSMSTYFDATEFPEDFSNKEDALAKLNGWASDKTKQRIPKILNEIQNDEVMFLVNALYLKADWKTGFVEGSTREGDFMLSNGNSVKADFMYADNHFKYYGDDKLEALELPYKDDEIAMYFIKSKSNNISELISSFNFSKFEEITKNMKTERYMAYIPKFTVEYKNESTEAALKQMGIKQAFRNGADLSSMAQEKNIYISRIVHKTFLTIDEKGTEGAAVTVGGVVNLSLPPSIRFDSPFVILLADKASHNILFMGRISNPK